MADIVLADAAGVSETYEGVNAIGVDTPDGGVALYYSEDVIPTPDWENLENKPFGEIDGTVKKLDVKYLPDEAATKDYVRDEISKIEVSGGSVGSGSIRETDLFAKQSVDGFGASSNYGGLYAYGFNFPESGFTDILTNSFELTIGETYFVEWDGIEYECVANDASAVIEGAVFLGNGSLFGLPGNNEPFALGVISGSGVTFISITETVSSHTIRVYRKVAKSGVSWDDIFDKPFYSNVAKIFSGTVTFVDSLDGPVAFDLAGSIPLIIGNTYIFNWNGTEYESECFSYDGAPAVGSTMPLTNSYDGIPATFVYDPDGVVGGGNQYYIFPVDTDTLTIGTPYTFSIVSGTTKYLDNKYLEFMIVSEDKVIIEPTSVTFPLITENTEDPEKSIFGAQGPSLYSMMSGIQAGKTYRCTVDNDEYIFTAVDLSAMYDEPTVSTINRVVGLGNMAILNAGPDTGEPVAMAVIDFVTLDGIRQQGGVMHGYHTSADQIWSLTASLTELGGVMIDPAYLPSGYGSGSSDGGSSLPEVSTSDNGKVMAVVNGAWTAQSITHPTELPTVSSSDDNKVLTVVNGVWSTSTPTSGLPEVTTDDNTKVLTVVDGVWTASDMTHPTELPTVTADDAGKFLRVGVDGSWIVETIQDVSEVGL